VWCVVNKFFCPPSQALGCLLLLVDGYGGNGSLWPVGHRNGIEYCIGQYGFGGHLGYCF
jgi:hypothetical protein